MSTDIAKYKTLDFTSDFMFCKILVNNPELCKESSRDLNKVEKSE